MLATKNFHLPRWDGSDCNLLVIAEQGIGDEIAFASCFPDLLKDCPRAVIECDSRLIPIFERSFDARFISRWNEARERKIWADYKDAKFDMFIPAGELPKLYRRSREAFSGEAYLKDGRSACGKRQFPAYGISWIGRQGRIDPSELRVNDDACYNLQYGANDRPAFCLPTGLDNTNDINAMFDFVSSLDAIVCVPNTLAHIGGSLGVTTHVVRPEPVYAGDREDEPEFHNRLRWEFGLFNGRTPWYNSVRTYRNVREFRMKMGINNERGKARSASERKSYY